MKLSAIFPRNANASIALITIQSIRHIRHSIALEIQTSLPYRTFRLVSN